ncbi:MAG: SCP2 sterol-binding domain-containing protein [Paracoccaceae bacterium]
MDDLIASAVDALNRRLTDGFPAGSAKFIVQDIGAITVDSSGARAADLPADVTLRASADTFIALVEGRLDPARAVMTGKLGIEGDIAMAMQLARALG